jgi:hypothetical protein
VISPNRPHSLAIFQSSNSALVLLHTSLGIDANLSKKKKNLTVSSIQLDLAMRMISELMSFLSALATAMLTLGHEALKVVSFACKNCDKLSNVRRLNQTSLAKEHCRRKWLIVSASWQHRRAR